ncbi:MAG: S-layer homology domain-containing protein, partial [Dysosmobacter welbionis]
LTEEAGTQGDLSAFSDKDAVSAWAQEAMAWAVGEGLLSGSPEGQLNPQGNTTRAELAQILMNYVA